MPILGQDTDRKSMLRFLLPLAVTMSVVSCAAIAGIETARVDPKLNADGEGGTGGSGGEGSKATGEDPLCREYCDLMLAHCGDPATSYQQFETDGICMGFCARLPRGSESDTLVNSLWCRVKQARLAEKAGSEAETNCQAAGPGSDNITCGPKCATYCRLMREICPTDFSANYTDDGACLEECLSLPTAGEYNAKPAHDLRLNDVNCRLYHLTAAAVPDFTSTHCPHPIGAKSACTQ